MFKFHIVPTPYRNDTAPSQHVIYNRRYNALIQYKIT